MNSTIVAELILIGDGMSGKTSLLKKIAEIAYQEIVQEFERYVRQKNLPTFHEWLKSKKETELSAALEQLGDKEYTFTDYLKWLQQNNVSLEHWMKTNHYTLDKLLQKETNVATAGMDTFNIIFPFRGKKINFKGYDLGGQNIYDQIRQIIAQIAKKDNFLLIVFDSTRFFSCQNSIRHLKEVIEKKQEKEEALPFLVAIANKIDFHQYLLNSPQMIDNLSNKIYEALENVKTKGMTYRVPHLLQKNAQREITIEKTTLLGFEHLEALIYYVISTNYGSEFNKSPLTEDNAKSFSREVAMQLILHQHREDYREFYDKVSQLVFAQRPLAVQYMTGLDVADDGIERPSITMLNKLRKRYQGIELDLTSPDINQVLIKKMILYAINTQPIFDSIKEITNHLLYTNALNGDGVPELISLIINQAPQLTAKKEQKTKKSFRRF